MSLPRSLKISLPGLWRIGQRFWPQIRKQRPLLVVSFLALLAEIALHLLEPWPLKFIFDHIIMVEPGQTTSTFFFGEVGADLKTLDPIVLLTLTALAVVAITGLRATAAYFGTVGLALAGSRVLAEVRGNLYRHLQRLSLSFHTRTRSGDLLTRVISDIGRLQEITITAILPLLINCLTLVSMLGLMFWLNWQLALVALAVFPLFSLSLVHLTGRIQSAARQQRRREGAMAATAAESISAIKVVQALSLETTLEQAFSSENTKNLSEGVKGKRLAAGLGRTVDVLTAVGTALVLWYGAQLVLGGVLSPGELLVFIAYLKSAFKPMRDLAKYTGRIAQAAASGERVIEVLDTTPDIRDRPNAIPAPPFRGAVRFENVSFAYEPGRPILEKINFEVHPGQQVALVGPSGSGKSTLVSLLLRLYDPQEGRVIIDGGDIRDYKLESLRSQIGMVLQESLLFAVSVRDNIAYGWLDATDMEIEAAARLANAHDFIMALPQGYDTILGERGATLSGGERQRLAIARAAVRRASLLIFDEPTTGLDRENERVVSEALDRLAQGHTTFRIAHNLHTVERADLILYLEDGRIVEHGTHAELMRLGDSYAAMVVLHAERALDNGHAHTSPEGTHALTS
jgi:ATP-binding cassette subfamily B protein